MTQDSRDLIELAARRGRTVARHAEFNGPAASAEVLAVDAGIYAAAGLGASDHTNAAGTALLLRGYHHQNGLQHFETSALKLNAMPGVVAVVAASHGQDPRFMHGDMLVLGRPVDATLALFTGQNALSFMDSGAVLNSVLTHFESLRVTPPPVPAWVRRRGNWISLAAEERFAAA